MSPSEQWEASMVAYRAEAPKLIAQMEALLTRAKESVAAGRYTEAAGFVKAVQEMLGDQDVFDTLATDEQFQVEDAAVMPGGGSDG